jgi:hypothetical protein
MEKVALLVVYNHRFDRNIPIVEKIYKDRFNNIFHIVPFYDGNKENVIPVYENSYYFQGYIAQAYTHLVGKGFTHFFVIADDLILNPKVNEENLWDELGIAKDDNLLPDLKILQTYGYWRQIPRALRYNPSPKGVEIGKVLPTREKAIEIFKERGIPTTKIEISSLISHKNLKEFAKSIYHFPFKFSLPYPLVGGYADIFLVTNDIMGKFCNYCGAFAATNLFVEIAIPTALQLATNKIKYITDGKLKNGALWTDSEKNGFNSKYSFNFKNLMDNFPKDKLYIHPVKLSKWDTSSL